MNDSIQASNATDPHVWISTIRLTGGSVVPLPSVGVTAVVGGNNTGKSTLLRQIAEWLRSGLRPPRHGQYVLLDSLEIRKAGSAGDFENWLEKNAAYIRQTATNPTVTEGFARAGANVLPRSQIPSAWDMVETNHLGNFNLANFLVYSADAGGRSGSGFGASRRQRPGQAPTDWMHHLEDNSDLFREVDNLYHEIFGEKLTMDKLGTQLTLRVGQPSEAVPPPGYYDDEVPFMEELEKLEPLSAQGDGMKSLMGLLLPIITATHHIVIVDEPEAFLHPPQAVKLGEVLGTLAKRVGIQVILATHDRNILVGLLRSNSPLAVVRLSRRASVTNVHQLEPEKIAEIWSDPVLRYSNVLDGLFHRLVVLAEDDSDCTFYAAALDAAHEESRLPFPPSEVLLVPTGGKDGMHTVVAALRALEVPVVASPDLDILDDETKLERLVTALRGNWSDYREDYRAVIRQFQRPRDQVPASAVLSQVKDLLENKVRDSPGRMWDSDLRESVRVLTRSGASPWEELKKQGIRAFSSETELRAQRLLDQFGAIGLVPVRIGTLEAFAAGYGITIRKGRGWLAEALRQGVHRSDAALQHVRRLVGA